MCWPSATLKTVSHPDAALAAKGINFTTPAHLQRGGLLALNGVAYAGYGGNSGDCQECAHLLIALQNVIADSFWIDDSPVHRSVAFEGSSYTGQQQQHLPAVWVLWARAGDFLVLTSMCFLNRCCWCMQTGGASWG